MPSRHHPWSCLQAGSPRRYKHFSQQVHSASCDQTGRSKRMCSWTQEYRRQPRALHCSKIVAMRRPVCGTPERSRAGLSASAHPM
jgi:hypothetical protein